MDETDEGGLSCACLALNGGDAANGEVVAELVQDSSVFIIRIRYVVYAYASFGKAYGFAFGFGRCFLQLHQSVAGRYTVDDDGNVSCQFAEGTLYLTYQLNEGNHHTIGYLAIVQSVHSPQEGDEVSASESCAQHSCRKTAEECPLLYLFA